MKLKIVISAIVVLLVAFGIVYFLFNKPHRNPGTEAGISINAYDLFRQYEENEDLGNARYLDKVVRVSGRISEITENQEHEQVLTLATGNALFGIRCTMQTPAATAHVNDSVSIKGICTGFLTDVILTSAFVESK
ncbi:MAG: hypothetical protein KF775_19325 [Cyclobacteriaceae bacterium]|nr:hypothetical protein [Cyclobacteriaceae bacterium]